MKRHVNVNLGPMSLATLNHQSGAMRTVKNISEYDQEIPQPHSVERVRGATEQ